MNAIEQIRAELDALKQRVAMLELKTGITMSQEICAGYCNQPTSDPGGMCQPCRERERHEDAKRRREERGRC